MSVRVIIDTMVYDILAADHSFRLLVKEKQESGLIRLLSTRIENDQLAAMPSARDIGQRLAVQTTRVGAAVFVWDVSHFDEDRFGTDEANAAFNQLQGGNTEHTEDAMIGATAFTDADILVTNDKKFAKRFRALASVTRVMTVAEFQMYLATLT